MFTFYLKSKLKMIVIWTLILVGFIYASLTKYEAFAVDIEGTKQLLDAFPKIIMQVYGIDDVDITSLGGYFSIVSLYVAIMLAIYGAILGSKIIYEEESLSTSEFIFTKPVSRKKVYYTKFLVSLTTITILNILVIAINYIILKNMYHVFDNYFMLSLVQYLISVFGLCLGTFLTTLKFNKFAAILSAAIITNMFILKTFAQIKVLNFSYITPFYAFSNDRILENNISIVHIIYYIVVCIIFVVAGNILLNKRDIK